MLVTKRRYFDFVTLFCLYQVCLKCRKLIYESFSNQWTVPAILKSGNLIVKIEIVLLKNESQTTTIIFSYA